MDAALQPEQPRAKHSAASLFNEMVADVADSLEETLTRLSTQQLRQRAIEAGCESDKVVEAEQSATPKADVSRPSTPSASHYI